MEASEETLPFERTPAEAAELISRGAQLIDVRQPHEFESGHLPGATLIGLDELARDSNSVDRDRTVVFYCRSGNRSGMAAQAFSEAGVDAVSVSGGILAWSAAGQKLEPADGYVAEPGEAAAILEARKRASS